MHFQTVTSLYTRRCRDKRLACFSSCQSTADTFNMRQPRRSEKSESRATNGPKITLYSVVVYRKDPTKNKDKYVKLDLCMNRRFIIMERLWARLHKSVREKGLRQLATLSMMGISTVRRSTLWAALCDDRTGHFSRALDAISPLQLQRIYINKLNENVPFINTPHAQHEYSSVKCDS
uniref:Uncharacterized protein n=1 Tax=Trichogramma kaykai TaxID=54128 RepID=A0ABD2XE12_9HYME